MECISFSPIVEITEEMGRLDTEADTFPYNREAPFRVYRTVRRDGIYIDSE